MNRCECKWNMYETYKLRYNSMGTMLYSNYRPFTWISTFTYRTSLVIVSCLCEHILNLWVLFDNRFCKFSIIAPKSIELEMGALCDQCSVKLIIYFSGQSAGKRGSVVYQINSAATFIFIGMFHPKTPKESIVCRSITFVPVMHAFAII